ncbi:MipA/OmpV family protein [Herbaspirillum robiniae]|uniref:MipA/OmpV family protein n=1 Tax=Herbaspirillum robiniae TaxID=2014887 RepID=UPI001A9C7EDF|nr:MipA/OmpV family protein [Herbaspirillum robiniae]
MQYPQSRIRRLRRRGTLHLFPLALLCGAAAPVVAQPVDPALASAAPGEGVLTLGAGAAFGPRYSGSDKRAGSAALLFDYVSPGGFFAGTARGIGYGNQHGMWRYSAALGYRPGRKDSDQNGLTGATGSAYLRGMGEVKGSAVALLGVGLAPADWVALALQAELPLSQRDNGSVLRFSFSTPLYRGQDDTLTFGLTASFGDGKYMRTYYGVSESQSAASGFAAYRPKAGLFEHRLELGWRHKFNAEWAFNVSAGVRQLTSDAGKSPIVQRKTAPVGSLFVTYTY